MELRLPLVLLLVLALAFSTLLWLGPSFSTVISFFWPLLVSTAFFLAAVALLCRISPPPSDTAGDLPGEELMDYVAGQPQEEDTMDESKDGDAEAEAARVDHRKSE